MNIIRWLRRWIEQKLYWNSYREALQYSRGWMSFEHYMQLKKRLHPLIKQWKREMRK